MRRRFIAFLALATTVNAQSLLVYPSVNYNDLNPSALATSVVVGAVRLTAKINDGADPLNLTNGFVRAPLLIVNQTDFYTNTPVQALTTNEPGTLRWYFVASPAGLYRISSTAEFVGGTGVEYQLVFDAYLTVTSMPASTISATVTSQITVANDTNVVSLSLVPLIPSNGFVGTPSVPWGEVNAVTGRFSGSLIVEGDLDVSGAISAVDTSKVALAGDTMVGPLTGTTIYATAFIGSGAGLTDLDYNDITNPPSISGGSSPYEWSGGSIQPTNGAHSVSTNAGNVIAGGEANIVDGASTYSTIGGGLSSTNRGYGAVIGGGQQNFIGFGVQRSTVGGGMFNRILSGDYATIAGGGDSSIGTANVISGGTYNVVSGGNANSIAASVPNASFHQQNVIAGGALGYAGGLRSFVAGGGGNHATGNVAFAAGHYARAGSGMFVWSDFRSTASDPFGQSLQTNSVAFRARNWAWLQTDPGEATNLWGVLAVKVITNSTPTRFLPTIPHRQGVYDAGSNILWIATGTTTNDYRGAEFALTP